MSGGSLADTGQSKVTTPFDIAPLTTHTATEAYNLVLQRAGVILPNRDTLDARIVQDVQNRTGRVIDVQGGFPHGTAYPQTASAWPALASAPAPADTDHDGMPDAWEMAHGLNPNSASDRSSVTPTGYTQLENYLNSLASDALNIKSSLTAFSQNGQLPSAVQRYEVSGNRLSGPVQVIPPAGFEISLNGTTWFDASNGLTLTPSAGVLAPVTVEVRLSAGAEGSYAGPIQHTLYAGGSVNLPVNGNRSTATSIGGVDAPSPLAIYPNPAGSAITVSHPTAGYHTGLVLFSQDGKKLAHFDCAAGSSKTEVSVQQLSAGTYFIQFIQKGRSYTLPFVKK